MWLPPNGWFTRENPIKGVPPWAPMYGTPHIDKQNWLVDWGFGGFEHLTLGGVAEDFRRIPEVWHHIPNHWATIREHSIDHNPCNHLTGSSHAKKKSGVSRRCEPVFSNIYIFIHRYTSSYLYICIFYIYIYIYMYSMLTMDSILWVYWNKHPAWSNTNFHFFTVELPICIIFFCNMNIHLYFLRNAEIILSWILKHPDRLIILTFESKIKHLQA